MEDFMEPDPQEILVDAAGQPVPPSPALPSEEERRAVRSRLDPRDPEARVVWGWFARAFKLNATTFVAGDRDATIRNEGQRATICVIADVAGVAPFDFERK